MRLQDLTAAALCRPVLVQLLLVYGMAYLVSPAPIPQLPQIPQQIQEVVSHRLVRLFVMRLDMTGGDARIPLVVTTTMGFLRSLVVTPRVFPGEITSIKSGALEAPFLF